MYELKQYIFRQYKVIINQLNTWFESHKLFSKYKLCILTFFHNLR